MKLERLKRGDYRKNNQDMHLSKDSWENFSISEAKKLVESNFKTLKMSRPDDDISFMKWNSVKERLEEGFVVELVKGFIRKKDDKPKCPYCGNTIHSAALSRRGNNIEICSVCGKREAYEDITGQRGE